MVTDSPRARTGVLPSLVALLLLTGAPACGPDGPEEGNASDTVDEASMVAAGEADAASAAESEARFPEATPTAGWSDRRAMAEADSLFPHSEHRKVECQRCHERPEGHVTHMNANCTACHAQPAGFASLPERAPIECAQCHHEGTQGRACTSCHDRDAVGSRPVLTTVSTAGGENVRVRSLIFSHTLHRQEDCRSCHTEAVTRDFIGDCSTCHEAHHRPEAECTTCHEAANLAPHTNAVHAGCGGSGCHEDPTVLSLPATRNVCLTCHPTMREHKEGRECAACHVGVSAARGRPAGGGR